MKASRPLALLVVSGALTVGAALHGAGCQATPITVPVRALERSGRVSFVCLDPPGPAGTVEEPLSKCTAQQFPSINEYLSADDAGNIDAGSGALPHLYALVTQTTRGEIAVIDTSSSASSVLDENPLEPGANFLPVGALPTGIVSTPGSVATFVGVGEIGRAGIFAIPSSRLRPTAADSDAGSPEGGLLIPPPEAGPVPQLSSWPACALPSAPGDMILVADPAVGVTERPSCDAPYQIPGDADLISTREKGGRQKLVVAMPAAGGILVLDAQAILNLAPGSFAACPVERWVPLEVDLTGLGKVQPPPTGEACVNPAVVTPPLQASYPARPGGMSYAAGVLYIADLSAPVVHVVDLLTPCNPVERAPLLPTSAEQPARVVTTSRVAVSPFPTPDLRRFVYATDVDDGSIMTFDVGPGAAGRRPLVRPGAVWNPLQPRDRIRYAAPVADIIVVQRDIPETNPITGVAVSGVRCDPNPYLVTCTATSTSCDIAGAYQTHTAAGDSTAYTAGAGPLKLRGEFAYAALSNGKVAVIDVDDFDAACRGPSQPSTLFGFPGVGSPCAQHSDCGTALCVQGLCQACTAVTDCPPAPLVNPMPPPQIINKTVCGPAVEGSVEVPSGACYAANKTSAELSHLVVEPNAPRSANYEVQVDAIGDHVPGLVTFPRLYGPDGSLLPFDGSSPRMAGILPLGSLPLYVGGLPASAADIAANHALDINYEDPRAQIADQNWTATFEGPLPGFDQRQARLDLTPSKVASLVEPDGRFCDLGVLSQGAMTDILGAAHADASRAPALADYVQVFSDLPGDQSAYWTNANGAVDKSACNGTTCSYTECLQAFGAVDLPLPGRDLRIVEAYQDHVEVELRSAQTKIKACTAQTDCGVGNPCVQGSCRKPCTADTECGAGNHCSTGACPTPLTVPLTLDDLCCCLPDAVSFAIRGGDQWIMVGDGSGFIHHVVADAATGRCRNTCDPYAARKNGRILEPPGTCASDAECGDVTSGRVCDATTHTCQVGCRWKNGNGCPTGDVCSVPATPTLTACGPGMFTCAKGTTKCASNADCKTAGEVCDGFTSMKKGNCAKCIPSAQQCDGVSQCDGGSDEAPANANCAVGTCSGPTVTPALPGESDFRSPMFHFAILPPPSTGACSPGCPTGEICNADKRCVWPSLRDSNFRFTTNGSFTPLLVGLSTDATALIQPQAITYLPSTGELAITDGNINGLIFISLSSATQTRSFF